MAGACNGCPDRFIGCHATCEKPEHLAEIEMRERIKANRRKNIESYSFYKAVRSHNCRRK
jgi:hypothetical protein